MFEKHTLQGTNIFPKTQKWHFEDDFPFPKVGYVNPLEGSSLMYPVHLDDPRRTRTS